MTSSIESGHQPIQTDSAKQRKLQQSEAISGEGNTLEYLTFSGQHNRENIGTRMWRQLYGMVPLNHDSSQLAKPQMNIMDEHLMHAMGLDSDNSSPAWAQAVTISPATMAGVCNLDNGTTTKGENQSQRIWKAGSQAEKTGGGLRGL
ncbi:hypothetical protein K438DRAFT_1749829 [Mycena galopus ATCC 62051]|nr:hypothetical protein K438DRAFT_1749829 [Mycena galopus ATCC 62051]